MAERVTREYIFLLSVDSGASWQQVSKALYVAAERAAGFHNTLGMPNEPATSYWSNGSVSGKVTYGSARP